MLHPDSEARRERFVELGGVVPEPGEERDLLLAILDSGSFLPGLIFAGDAPAAWQRLAGDPWLRRAQPGALFWSQASAEAAPPPGFHAFKTRRRDYPPRRSA